MRLRYADAATVRLARDALNFAQQEAGALRNAIKLVRAGNIRGAAQVAEAADELAVEWLDKTRQLLDATSGKAVTTEWQEVNRRHFNEGQVQEGYATLLAPCWRKGKDPKIRAYLESSLAQLAHNAQTKAWEVKQLLQVI